MYVDDEGVNVKRKVAFQYSILPINLYSLREKSAIGFFILIVDFS